MQEQMDISKPETVFKCWVDLYSDQLYSWALYKINHHETAEDLVQECFLAAYQSISRFEGRSEVKTWLFSILNNKIADHYRKSFRQPQTTESSPGEQADPFFDEHGEWRDAQRPQPWQEEEHSELLDNPDFRKAMYNCLDKLPERWRFALQSKYLGTKKGDLICQELGITPTLFWQMLHRGKLQLRKCLELNWFKK